MGIRNLIQTRKTPKESHTELDMNTINLVRKLDKKIDKKIPQYNDKIPLSKVGIGPQSNHEF